MLFQEEETSYQNQIGQENFDRQESSQGIDYDVSDLLMKAIAPEEGETTESKHSAQVTIITVDSTISKPAIIIDREYFYTNC